MTDSVPIRAGWTVCDDCTYTPGAEIPCCCEYATSGAYCPDHIAARAAIGLTEPPCIAGDHEPNDAGTACYYCGLPAEPVDPQEAAEALYEALQIAQDRDRAQLARIGGRAILRYYSSTTRDYRPWTISLLHSDSQAAHDEADACYWRAVRADRDAGLNLTRTWWPVMLADR